MLSSTESHSSDKSSNSSIVTPGDMADSSTLIVCETEWDDYADPLSPVGPTTTSILGNGTPIRASGSSLDEQQQSNHFTGCNEKPELGDQAQKLNSKEQTRNRLDITQPDGLLTSDWQGCHHVKDKDIMTDAIAALLGNDLSNDYKEKAAGAFGLRQGWGRLGSCTWNNMPAVCQMYELP